ncbi:MAG: hypothetical protein NVS1B16_11880 [Pseudarthrobacter sp.]
MLDAAGCGHDLPVDYMGGHLVPDQPVLVNDRRGPEPHLKGNVDQVRGVPQLDIDGRQEDAEPGGQQEQGQQGGHEQGQVGVGRLVAEHAEEKQQHKALQEEMHQGRPDG